MAGWLYIGHSIVIQSYGFFYDAEELFFPIILKTLIVFCDRWKTASVSVTEAARTKSIKDRQFLSLDNLPLISHDRLSGVLCNIFILLPLTNTSLFPDELSPTKHLVGHKWLHHQANDFISSPPFICVKRSYGWADEFVSIWDNCIA